MILTGVHWSSLHQLFYRNPVQHTILGVMHNWFEGLLQHHTRRCWGIGVTISSGDLETEKDKTLPSSGDADADFDMLDDELNALQTESQQYGDTPIHIKHLHSETFLSSDSASGCTNSTGDDDDFQPSDDSDEGEDEDKDVDEARSLCVFDAAMLSKIHMCIAEAVIPSWIDRPPANLGDKSHGKLKADNWLTLLTIFFPLILPEIWVSSSNNQHLALLDNFYDLVTCTNIIRSHLVLPTSADIYLHHYIKYRKSLKHLFPDVKTHPNHHYAMHNAEFMKYWGPLTQVSEFPYEWHNGTLQKIKTNQHMWELDFTMLHQIC